MKDFFLTSEFFDRLCTLLLDGRSKFRHLLIYIYANICKVNVLTGCDIFFVVFYINYLHFDTPKFIKWPTENGANITTN